VKQRIHGSEIGFCGTRIIQSYGPKIFFIAGAQIFKGLTAGKRANGGAFDEGGFAQVNRFQFFPRGQSPVARAGCEPAQTSPRQEKEGCGLLQNQRFTSGPDQEFPLRRGVTGPRRAWARLEGLGLQGIARRLIS